MDRKRTIALVVAACVLVPLLLCGLGYALLAGGLSAAQASADREVRDLVLDRVASTYPGEGFTVVREWVSGNVLGDSFMPYGDAGYGTDAVLVLSPDDGSPDFVAWLEGYYGDGGVPQDNREAAVASAAMESELEEALAASLPEGTELVARAITYRGGEDYGPDDSGTLYVLLPAGHSGDDELLSIWRALAERWAGKNYVLYFVDSGPQQARDLAWLRGFNDFDSDDWPFEGRNLPLFRLNGMKDGEPSLEALRDARERMEGSSD